MSKKIEDSELQTLTLSPTNTNDDESSLFINPASDETAFPISPPPSHSTLTTSSSTLTGEKRRLERMTSAPGGTSTTKPFPAFRVSTPPASSRVTYTNERAPDKKVELSKISRDRPTPSSSIGQKREAPRPPDPGHHSSKGPHGHSHKSLEAHTPEPPATSPEGKGPSRKTSMEVEGGKSMASNPHPGGGASPTKLPIPPSGRGSAGLRFPRVVRPGTKMRGPLLNFRKMERPTQHHTFMTDVADVRQIEQGLLQLMEDFQAGNLRAFGKDSRLRQMEAIREQQERLARLHFDVGAEQDLHPPLSEEGLRSSHDNMRTLMEQLAQLSESIERLHTNTSTSDRRTGTERKVSAQSTNGPAAPPRHHTGGPWGAQEPHHHHAGEASLHHSHTHHPSPGNPRISHSRHRPPPPLVTQAKNGKMADS